MDDGRTFVLNGLNFKLNKIDAFKQFHIVRRIGPLLAEIVKGAQSIGAVDDKSMNDQQKLEMFGKMATPFMEGISKLSDADADYVLLRLLSSVEVQQAEFGGVWSRIATDSAIARQDLELPTLLQVAGRALMFNLSGFFSLLPRQ